MSLKDYGLDGERLRKAIHIDTDQDYMLGDDQAFFCYPVRFPTVEITLAATTELCEIVDAIRKENRLSAIIRPVKEECRMELMPIVSLDSAKMYLRVDSADEDALIGILLLSAERMVMDVVRIGHEEWREIQKVTTDDDGAVLTVHTDAYSQDEIIQIRELLKVAILYAVGYLYEHREEADHHGLMMTLRNLLFAVREGVLSVKPSIHTKSASPPPSLFAGNLSSP